MSRTISVAKTKTTTAEETIFTVPTKNTGFWSLMYIVSTAGTNSPTVTWYDASENATHYIIGGKNLGTGEFVLLSDAVVAIEAGDQIKVSQSGTSSITYIATIELFTNQATQFHGG